MAEERVAVTRPQVTVLATKLHIPQPRPSLAPRPRLVTRLAQGWSLPLILISAPAGFGKTTLVGEWIAQAH